ncbi:C39 family peptidase [Arthrospira platensis SPKY2]
MYKVIPNNYTVLKTVPLDSSQLKSEEIVAINQGEELFVDSINFERNEHIKLEFSTNRSPLEGYKYLYAYLPHISIEDESGRIIIDIEDPYPSEINLNVPFYSQLDNHYNPTGSCNVTSVAMCLSYLGVRPGGVYSQLEDELYRYMIDRGLSRHSPYDLAKVVRDYGHKDTFRTDATIEDCKNHLFNKKMPLIIHGYFTSFGHIIVIRGYSDNGFFVNDPYGEWFSTGYRTDLTGENLLYSYELIKRTCIPDGSFWVHFIDR